MTGCRTCCHVHLAWVAQSSPCVPLLAAAAAAAAV